MIVSVAVLVCMVMNVGLGMHMVVGVCAAFVIVAVTVVVVVVMRVPGVRMSMVVPRCVSVAMRVRAGRPADSIPQSDRPDRNESKQGDAAPEHKGMNPGWRRRDRAPDAA